MKPVTIALLTAAAAFLTPASQADTRIHRGVSAGASAYCPPPVVSYVPAPTVVHAPPARGYWEEVVVKSWVPDRWITSRDRFGRLVRVFEPGYFTYHTDRVWVAPGSHIPHGRAHGYHRYGRR